MGIGIVVTGVRGVQKALADKAKAIDANLKTAIKKAALMVEASAKKSIQHGPKTGAIYTRGAISHQASAPGQAPATDTGALVSSITHKISLDGKTAVVGSNIDTALFLELGTRNMAPRPFLEPALEANRDGIEALIAKAVEEGKKK